MAMSMELAGNIAFIITMAGINTLLVFMLFVTKWRKDYLSVAWTAFFGMCALVLNLGLVRVLTPDSVDVFIMNYVRTPMYVVLSLATWALVVAGVRMAVAGRRRRRADKKVAILPPEGKI